MTVGSIFTHTKESQWVTSIIKSVRYMAGASFGANLARRLEHDLEFKRCKGDRDVGETVI